MGGEPSNGQIWWQPTEGHDRFGPLHFVLQTHGLVDVFRKHNPTACSFTSFSPDSSIEDRIDRFYLTHDIFHTSKSSAVQVFPYSDHDGFFMNFPLQTHQNEARVTGN